MSQYTITGFDASAHLSEETMKASWSAPIGVLTSIVCSAVFGFFLILCLLFSIQGDLQRTATTPTYQPVLQILLDIYDEDSAIVLFTLIIVCVWHCGLFSLTSNSRMMFAFGESSKCCREYRILTPAQLAITAFPRFSTTSTSDSKVQSGRSGLLQRWHSSLLFRLLDHRSPSQLPPLLQRLACTCHMACQS